MPVPDITEHRTDGRSRRGAADYGMRSGKSSARSGRAHKFEMLACIARGSIALKAFANELELARRLEGHS
jgi:hypothetical protein